MPATSTPVDSEAANEVGAIVRFTNADTTAHGVVAAIITQGDYKMARLVVHNYSRGRNASAYASALDLRLATDVDPEEMIRLLCIQAEVTSPDPDMLTAIIHDGHLICPYCAEKDQIVEHSRTVQVYKLTVSGEDEIDASGEDANFEDEVYECEACEANVTIPGTYTITYP